MCDEERENVTKCHYNRYYEMNLKTQNGYYESKRLVRQRLEFN